MPRLQACLSICELAASAVALSLLLSTFALIRSRTAVTPVRSAHLVAVTMDSIEEEAFPAEVSPGEERGGPRQLVTQSGTSIEEDSLAGSAATSSGRGRESGEKQVRDFGTARRRRVCSGEVEPLRVCCRSLPLERCTS